MNKTKLSKSKSGRKRSNPLKSIKSHFKKRPLAASAIVALIVAIVAVGSVQAVRITNDINANANSGGNAKLANNKLNEVESTVDPLDASDKKETPSTTPAPSSSPKPSDQDGEVPYHPVGGAGVMPKSGCYVGCATANPDFSLVLASDTYTAALGDTRIGPISASTSDGRSVSWTTPSCTDTSRPCLLGYTYQNGDMASKDFYIDTLPSTTVGTYSMYIGGTHGPSQQMVRKSFTLNIVAPN